MWSFIVVPCVGDRGIQVLGWYGYVSQYQVERLEIDGGTNAQRFTKIS